ncbi:uncharacterized protein LOC124933571 [Impatiens glandulifera]|uniref:uncharacterized protein LOC124933571 n=1 Tax=Impatiens glandulifera TaxID=253017 RepID=UPI001FB07054|nr:uncharacterized protein LOC124933571 [Impatiens glandulifera]XP_047329947.1 uncharacterized protein LOC124933571 [Impatiens glandulifera]
MLQFPGFMPQYPQSTKTSSFLLHSQWPQTNNDEALLALEESEFDEKCKEIRTAMSNTIVIGKTTAENDKQESENEAEEEDADNVEESEGDEFEQETG